MDDEQRIYIDSVKDARELQRKFDYFLLAVIAASLSLSTQALKPTDNIYFNTFLVLHWTLLIISFLAGMYRQEKINVFQKIEADLMPEKELFGVFKQSKATGETIYKDSQGAVWTTEDMDKVIENKEKVLKIGGERQEKVNKLVIRAYKIKKWAFVLGLIVFIGLKGFAAYQTTTKKVLKQSVSQSDSLKIK